MSGKNPLGLGKEPQAYEGINVIVPVGGWQVVRAKRDPTANDKKYPVATLWVDTSNNTVWILTSVSGGTVTWTEINSAPVVVAAAASPQTANSRSGQVTFSGVSIAAGATQSFVINNTAIPSSSTVILFTMVGATTGAALNIQSITNVAGTSSTIVVENGTGATTSTANITFTFLMLN